VIDPSVNIRVLLADDHPVVRQGLSLVLAEQPDIDVVGEAEDLDQLLSAIETSRPDVLILDLDLDPHCDDEMAGLKAVRAYDPSIRIVVYTAHDDEARIVEVMGYGVEGYILKSADLKELLTAIRVVHHGGSMMQPTIAATLMKHMRHSAVNQTPPGRVISPRELEVLHLLAEGRSNQQIAGQLLISENTVKYHISSIFSKLDVCNRTAAVVKAGQEGLLRRPDDR